MRYQQVQIEKYLKSNSVMKVEKYENISVMKRKPSCATTELILFAVSKGK